MGNKYKIYVIENVINNKKYIGKTSRTLENRLATHKKNAKRKVNRRLYDSMNFHGYNNFIIYEIDCLDNNQDANFKEIFYIKKFNTQNPELGYNMTKGGDGGNTGTYYKGISPYDWWVKKYGKEKADEMRKNGILLASKSNTKRMKGFSFEERFGKEKSDEIKSRISKTNKEKKIKPPIQYWENKTHPMLGKNHTKEAKKKIGLARKGKKYEDIIKDKSKIDKLKNEKRKSFLGEKNPRYVEKLSDDKKNEFLKMLIDGDKLVDISKKLNYSVYLLRLILKEWNIYNLQRLRLNDKKNEFLKKIKI